MTFGEKVKMYRTQKGWTLEELSKLTGLSVQAISAYETGKNRPLPVSKMAIASALHVKPSALDDDVRPTTGYAEISD